MVATSRILSDSQDYLFTCHESWDKNIQILNTAMKNINTDKTKSPVENTNKGKYDMLICKSIEIQGSCRTSFE